MHWFLWPVDKSYIKCTNFPEWSYARGLQVICEWNLWPEQMILDGSRSFRFWMQQFTTRWIQDEIIQPVRFNQEESAFPQICSILHVTRNLRNFPVANLLMPRICEFFLSWDFPALQYYDRHAICRWCGEEYWRVMRFFIRNMIADPRIFQRRIKHNKCWLNKSWDGPEINHEVD